MQRLLRVSGFGRLLMTLTVIGENNLSFIETSALDGGNVELAFQNILTGKIHAPFTVLN
jgi:hypothetical protein